jgi:hypothetical protein
LLGKNLKGDQAAVLDADQAELGLLLVALAVAAVAVARQRTATSLQISGVRSLSTSV